MRNYLLSFQYRLAKLEGKGYGSATYARETKAIRTLLNRHGKPEAQVVLDVGANVGNWTQHAMRNFPEAQFYLFEPSRKSADALKARYGNDPRVHITAAALSDKEGEAMLHTAIEGDTATSLYKRDLAHHGVSHNATYSVPTLTLDQFMERKKLSRIDVLKMDVEGHELAVLNGGEKWRKRAACIQFEFSGCNIDSRTFFKDFWMLLSPDFAIYRIAPFNLLPIRAYHDLHEYFAVTNYICINKRDV